MRELMKYLPIDIISVIVSTFDWYSKLDHKIVDYFIETECEITCKEIKKDILNYWKTTTQKYQIKSISGTITDRNINCTYEANVRCLPGSVVEIDNIVLFNYYKEFNGKHIPFYCDGINKFIKGGIFCSYGTPMLTIQFSNLIKYVFNYISETSFEVVGIYYDEIIKSYYNNGIINYLIYKDQKIREYWLYNRKIHRENDKPAIIDYYKNGKICNEIWYTNNKMHRENDQPVIIEYYKNGSVKLKRWMAFRNNNKPTEISFGVNNKICQLQWIDKDDNVIKIISYFHGGKHLIINYMSNDTPECPIKDIPEYPINMIHKYF